MPCNVNISREEKSSRKLDICMRTRLNFACCDNFFQSLISRSERVYFVLLSLRRSSSFYRCERGFVSMVMSYEALRKIFAFENS